MINPCSSETFSSSSLANLREFPTVTCITSFHMSRSSAAPWSVLGRPVSSSRALASLFFRKLERRAIQTQNQHAPSSTSSSPGFDRGSPSQNNSSSSILKSHPRNLSDYCDSEMCVSFQITLCPCTYSTKGIIYTESVCTGTKPGGPAELSTLFDEIAFIALIKTLHNSTTSSFPTISDSGFKTCQEKTSTSEGSHFKKHIECILHRTKWQCSNSCKYAFAVARIPAQIATASSPALQNFETTFIIRFLGFCSCLSITVLPELPSARQDIRSCGETGELLFVPLVLYQ